MLGFWSLSAAGAKLQNPARLLPLWTDRLRDEAPADEGRELTDEEIDQLFPE